MTFLSHFTMSCRRFTSKPFTMLFLNIRTFSYIITTIFSHLGTKIPYSLKQFLFKQLPGKCLLVSVIYCNAKLGGLNQLFYYLKLNYAQLDSYTPRDSG